MYERNRKKTAVEETESRVEKKSESKKGMIKDKGSEEDYDPESE